jgi:hypothetical protein
LYRHQPGFPPRTCCGQQQQASGGEARGVNPVDNITNLELLPKLSVIDDGLGISVTTVTFKYDRAIQGVYGFNVELPIARFESPFGNDNGLGDMNLRFRAQRRVGERVTVLTGVETVLPTATADSLGSGKFQLNPIFAGVYAFSRTTFLAAVAKHQFSVAGDDEREDIRLGQYRLLLGYTSPKGYWVVADFQQWADYKNNGRLDFSPEVEVGKMVGPTTGVWIRGGGHGRLESPGLDAWRRHSLHYVLKLGVEHR